MTLTRDRQDAPDAGFGTPGASAVSPLGRQVARTLFPARLLLRWLRDRAGLANPRPKVFFIGFNKTGTKSLQTLFLDNGYLPAHSSTYMARRLNLPPFAQLMKDNREAGRPLLRGLGHYDVYMDMISLTASEVIEANGWFRDLEAQNPGAYFVFNDRPVEKWVRSRLSHEGGPRGSFVKRYASAMGIGEAEAPDHWRDHYARHKAEVLAHFAGKPRFMLFDIESGRPSDLTAFLAADYRLDPRMWAHQGSAQQRHRNLKAGLAP